MFRIVLAAGAVAALTSVADAAPYCAPGKFYRVSQKTCVDKDAAVRAGVVAPEHARAKASATRRPARLERGRAARAARMEALREARRARRIARLEASRARLRAAGARTQNAVAAEETRRSGAIMFAPVKAASGPAASPFGALPDPWRSDGVNVPQETLFSLRLSAEE